MCERRHGPDCARRNSGIVRVEGVEEGGLAAGGDQGDRHANDIRNTRGRVKTAAGSAVHISRAEKFLSLASRLLGSAEVTEKPQYRPMVHSGFVIEQQKRIRDVSRWLKTDVF